MSGDPRMSVIGRVEFGPHQQTTTGGDFCLVCGQIGGHGSLPCPNLQVSDSPTPKYAPDPFPLRAGAQPLDIGRQLARIIELLETISARLRL